MKRTNALGAEDTLNETITRFRSSLSLYCAAVLKIRTKKPEIVPMTPNFAQRKVQKIATEQLRSIGKIRLVILKARQEGISTWVAARFFRSVHLWPGIVALVVADELSRAESIFSIYERYYENLPPEIAPRKKTTARGRHMKFAHDSEIGVRPATDAQAGRGSTIHRLHASELAYWGLGARDTWVSLMQAVPQDGGEVIVESTANGSGGLFHELWEQAESGAGDWLAIFLPWWIHEEYSIDCSDELRERIDESLDDFELVALGDGIPYEGESHRLSYNQLAWRRAVIAENFGGGTIGDRPGVAAIRSFQVEYPATAEEAFLVSGSCFFDEMILRKMTLKTQDPKLHGKLRYEADFKRYVIDPKKLGPVSIWEDPSPDHHYVIGVDTAEGKLSTATRSARNPHGLGGDDDRDASVAIVLRLPSGGEGPRIVAELHGRLAPEVFTEQLEKLGKHYACGGGSTGYIRANALIAVESNHSSGQTILRLLKEHYRYRPLYWQREVNKRTHKVGTRLGWRTDEMTRMIALDFLGELIRNHTLDIPSRQVIRECVTFITWPSGKPAADDGTHDDRVIATAIAAQMMKEHRHTTDMPLPSYDVDDDTQTG